VTKAAFYLIIICLITDNTIRLYQQGTKLLG